MNPRAALSVAALLLTSTPALAIDVVSVDPPAESLTAARTAVIRVTFDAPVAPASVTPETLRAFARWSGPATGTRTVSADGLTVTLTPERPFTAGELVHVNLSHDLRGTDASTLRNEGFAYRFWTRTAVADAEFEESHRAVVRDFSAVPVRIYGGLACDLDLDGWLDLSIVNEGSADIRILENRDDGSGTFAPFREPTTPIDVGASPSEADDFDQDGAIDVAVANVHADSVTVLFGDGAAGFLDPLTLTPAPEPHGMALLDVDGDGDRDIVTTNKSTSRLTLMRNNGDRTFGAAEVFEGGGAGEWGLVAADMNADGIFDLVVGLNDSREVNVLLGNGDGTFTAGTPVDGGGWMWMVDAADLDGDGRLDVAATKGFPGNSGGGVIFLGNGAGALGAARHLDDIGHTPATDFGDLDGDGDLDLILSSYGSSLWQVLRNDGSANFTPVVDIPARRNPGCAVAFDADNDGDLDLALLDEVADEVIVVRNRPPTPTTAAALSPSSVRLRLGSAKRKRPRLTAEGIVHFGPGGADLSLPVNVTVGRRSTIVALDGVRGRGGAVRFDYGNDTVRLRLRTSADGSSRGKFSLVVDEDLAGALDDPDDLALSIRSGGFDAVAHVTLVDGKFTRRRQPAALREPALTVSKLRAKLTGAGGDTLRLKLAMPGADEPPTEAPGITVTVGEYSQTIPAAALAPKRGRFKLRNPIDALRGLTYSPAAGTLSVSLKGADLGPFLDGPQDVTITLELDDERRRVTVRAGRRGRTLRY